MSDLGDAASFKTVSDVEEGFLSNELISLFIEDEPLKWSQADLQQMTEINQKLGKPPPQAAPIQLLPVEILETIALQLTAFNDIRFLANTCTYFRRIFFDGKNDIFWYKWSKAPGTFCRWNLGVYRPNRAYQKTIVNQQNGKRRKRCEYCMARAMKGEMFGRKACKDCWEELGIAASYLFLVKDVDVEGVKRHYLPNYSDITGYMDEYAKRAKAKAVQNLYYHKPSIKSQLEKAFPAGLHTIPDRTSPQLENFKRMLESLTEEVRHVKGSFLADNYSRYYWTGYKNPVNKDQKVKWWQVERLILDLISDHEVIHRVLQEELIKVEGEKNLRNAGYIVLPEPEKDYGNKSAISKNFPRINCDDQEDPEFVEQRGNEPEMIHDCTKDHYRAMRAKKFKELWHPKAEERFLSAVCGPKSLIVKTATQYKYRSSYYEGPFNSACVRTVTAMLDALKWVVPETSGDYTAESVNAYEQSQTGGGIKQYLVKKESSLSDV